MQRFLKKGIVVLAILALAGGGVFWWFSRNHHAMSFRTATVKRGDVVSTISATGTIEPLEVVDVGAQVAGQITAFGKDTTGKTIDYGSIIEKGTLLAKIDDSVYAADLALAKAQVEQGKAGEVSATANLAQAKAKADQAEADWNRAQELGPSEALARSLYDSYKANFEVAKANVDVADAAVTLAKVTTMQAQAGVDRAQRNYDFCTIASPVRGVIIDRRVNIGQTVVSSLSAPSLFLIAEDLTKMQIWVAVNEADIGRIRPGTPVIFTCDAFPGREFNGTVGKVRLNATMTQNVVMFTVEVNIENPEGVLLPYMTASVHFVVQKEGNALMVPNAALRWSPSDLAQISPDARLQQAADPAQNDPPGGGKEGKRGRKAKDRGATVWLKEGDFVRPIALKTGITDGVNTSVTCDELKEGQEVITGEELQSAQAATQNPFLPVFRRR